MSAAQRSSWASNRGKVLGLVIVAAVATGVGLFALLHASLTHGHHQSYDPVLYARSLWGVAHGEPFNPVYGMHWVGVHANWVLFPLALPARLFSAALVLAAAQAVALACTVAVVLLAALRAARAPESLVGAADSVADSVADSAADHDPAAVVVDVGAASYVADAAGLNPALVALWAMVAVCMSPLLLNPFFFDVRPDLIAVPLLCVGLLRAERLGRFDGAALACFVGAALVREEFALIAAAALVLAPLGRRELAKRLIVATLLAAYFAAYWWGIRPIFGGEVAAARAVEAAGALFGEAPHPGDGASFLPELIFALVAFGGGFALVGWRWLATALPGLAFVGLSTKMPEHALNFHYSMFAAPALVVASVSGLRRWVRQGRVGGDGALAASVAFAAFAYVALGAGPAGGRFQAEHFGWSEEAAAWQSDCHRLLAVIPGDAGVAMAPMFGAAQADRGPIWSLETLHRAMLDDGEVPQEVDWIALDVGRIATLGRHLVARERFQLVGIAAGRLALLERPPDPRRSPPVLAAPDVATLCIVPTIVWPAAGVELCDLRLDDERVVGTIARRAPAAPDVAPRALAVIAEAELGSTTLLAYGGLVDPSTLPIGVGIAMVSADRVRTPRLRFHLIDLEGRNFAGFPFPHDPSTEGQMGVTVDLPVVAREE